MSLSDRSTCSSLVTAGTFPFRSQTEGVRSGANRPLYPCNAQRLADAPQQNTGSGTRLTNSTKKAFGLRSRTTACAGESPRLTHVYLPQSQQQTKHSGGIQTWRDAEKPQQRRVAWSSWVERKKRLTVFTRFVRSSKPNPRDVATAGCKGTTHVPAT